ncbi:MAG: hypothetical protein EP330_26040 [Deltaproteobacteria bacterium]|nr:MAG: hypothetical protein EP330_26040 [Deltaproteobacteria bacterium]
MLFTLESDQIRALDQFSKNGEFYGAEMLFARFRTDPAVVAQILPNGLKPTPEARGVVFVAHYPSTNFECVYNEGALFLECERRGEKGLYCLSMPVDDDIALIGGRELFGYPKKMAERIELTRVGNRIVGSVVRRGTEILRIELDDAAPAEADAMGAFGVSTTDEAGAAAFLAPSFLYKYFPHPGSDGLDYLPRLIRQPNLLRPRLGLLRGRGRVTLNSTVRDPLGEVPVVEVTDCVYGRFDNTMLPGKVVGRAWNVWKFAKHAFFKTDIVACRLDRLQREERAKVEVA